MATINDVARRAAVTPATVSYVLSGKNSVSEKTRARVLAIVEELDYRPNLVARSLVRRRTFTLALLLPDIANPFYPEIVRAVEGIARGCGYHLLLCNTGSDPLLGRTYLREMAGRRVDGLLAFEGGLRVSDLSAAERRGMPVVLCNWEEQQEHDLPSVDLDFWQGGALAARHLLQLGHRRLAVVVHGASGGPPAHCRRFEGFQATLAAVGLPWSDHGVFYGDSTLQSGYRAAEALLGCPERPTAVFATNDLMAMGVMEAAGDHGLCVPNDLAVIGFDDIFLGTHVRPTLSTVAVPKDELAARAMELVLRLIEGEQPEPLHISVQPRLVVRRSTAAPGMVPAAATDERRMPDRTPVGLTPGC